MTLRSRVTRWFRWIDDRTGLTVLLPFAQKKEVPIHRHTLWYYLGGMVVFLFMVQVGTGVLLLFYYRPSADEAFESVQFLMAEVQFGWLVRSIHNWGANLMILVIFIHLFSVLLLRAYRPPRELTWMTGVGLLGVALGLGFTGYLLPWNELAFFATRVGTEIPGVVPLVGGFITTLLRGGDDVSGATLTRFYALHISVLPAVCFGLMALHVVLVQKHGMSIPPSVADRGGAVGSLKFVPNFLLRDLIGWLIALAILAALAAFLPAHLGEKADPFSPAPAGIKPEWYFMFMFHTLKLFPAHILGIEGELVGVGIFGLAGAALFFVPFLDRRRGPTRRDVWSYVYLGVIAYIVVFTYLGYTADVTA
jgi:quinol-cytochrome oxidoreductase complex cytochrome b subunit